MANRLYISKHALRQTIDTSSGKRCLHTTSLKSATVDTYAPPAATRTIPTTKTVTTDPSPLARLPTSHILRSLFLSAFFTTPLLFKPGFAVFHRIAKSQSRIFNPDSNPLLRFLIRPLVYDQFCAGKNATEIDQTSALIKQLGFSGVVLCYSKEVQVDSSGKTYGYSGSDSAIEAEVTQWREGTLETLEMTKEGDWIGIKFTGAGLQVTNALCNGEAPPKIFADAMDVICQRAIEKNSRIWIDAEQQAVQPAIDQWTYDLMRKYNRDRAVVYNTVQAYLKAARQKVQAQLNTAAEEGWISAIKLVRGAYISNDQRSLIHDTKPETDDSYNGIVADVLKGTNFKVFEKHPNVKHAFLCAGHNIDTVRMASGLATELSAKGELKVVPEFAQLQGMADDVGCELLQVGEQAAKNASPGDSMVFVPKVYKCLTWGTIQECMQYLTRRLVENRGAADRMRIGAAELRKELGRRILMRN